MGRSNSARRASEASAIETEVSSVALPGRRWRHSQRHREQPAADAVQPAADAEQMAIPRRPPTAAAACA